ncbi:MAG: YDG domain-containing protein [Lutibacter sp.]|nr:YDG domain-containing protein [Lutibacter sp.]
MALTGAVLSGADAGNYNLTSVATTIADITPKALVISITAEDKEYDGDAVADVTAAIASGLVTDDDVEVSASNGEFEDKNVGDDKEVTADVAISGGVDAGNYSANTTAETMADITALVITGNFTVDATKVYDGGTLSNVLTRTLNGVISPDVVILDGGTANYDNKNVANGKTVALTGAVLSGSDAGNYNLTSVGTTTADITQRSIDVTAQSDSRLYNGTTSSAVAPVVGALQTSDAIGTAPIQVYDTRNIGSNKTMTASGLVINDGNSGNNYAITYISNLTGVILVRPITITAVTDTKVYDGNTSSDKLPNVPALQTGDAIGTAPTQVYDTELAGTGKTMTASGLVINDNNNGDNYAISYVTNTTGVITQASTALTLTLSGYSVRYMDNLTYTAKITPLHTVTPLTGSVNFVIGSVTYNAVVVPIPGASDGSVQAMVINQLPASLLPGGYQVEATFVSTNNNYSGSTDTKELIIVPRNATPNAASGFYVGDGFAWTTGPSTSTATVTMVAAIKDLATLSGDVRGAKVSFYFVNGTVYTAIPSAQNLPVGLVDVTDGSIGTASAIVQLNIGSANSASFQIAIKITGAYTNNMGDPLAQTIVTVSKPVTGGFITGGSNLTNSNSSGYIKGASGLNTDYQFDIQYTKSGTNPKGKAKIFVRSYYDRNGILDAKLHTYIITTNAIALLNVGLPTATGTFSAKANLVEQITDEYGNITAVEAIEGGSTFQMVAFQNACEQKIAITLYRKAGGVWFSSNWDGTAAKSVLQDVNSGSQVYVFGGGTCPPTSLKTEAAKGVITPATTPVITPEIQALEKAEIAELLLFNVTAYPNPSADYFTLKLQGMLNEEMQKVEVNVFDLLGRQVYTKQGNAQDSYEFGQQFQVGVYLVTVKQGNNVASLKVIKK